MVKVIVADKKYNCEHLLGQFLTENDFDVLIEEDTDCYMPANCDIVAKTACEYDFNCSGCPKGSDELRIAFKFRKNYFTEHERELAYQGLRAAAKETQNRGIAAGPRMDGEGTRPWVTDEQYDILEWLMDPVESLDGSDPVDDIRARHSSGATKPATRGVVWLQHKVQKAQGAETDFIFDDWVEEVRKLPKDEMITRARYVAENFIGATTYANKVMSGVAGWYDRYPRIPYGRATAYTEHYPEKFEMAFPFLQSLNRGFKELLPWRWSNQKAAADKIDPAFLVPGTVFTTITVNNTFRTAAHYDAGDLSNGLSNLLVLSNNGKYSGGYLVFPEYRVAVNVRPGDLLLVNNHEILHGNTPIVLEEEGAERISIVCYFREGMLDLGSKEYEDLRYQFVVDRKNNKDHPNWKPLWNGVDAGCWESKEWYEYLLSQPNGRELMENYDKKLIKLFETPQAVLLDI